MQVRGFIILKNELIKSEFAYEFTENYLVIKIKC